MGAMVGRISDIGKNFKLSVGMSIRLWISVILIICVHLSHQKFLS